VGSGAAVITGSLHGCASHPDHLEGFPRPAPASKVRAERHAAVLRLAAATGSTGAAAAQASALGILSPTGSGAKRASRSLTGESSLAVDASAILKKGHSGGGPHAVHGTIKGNTKAVILSPEGVALEGELRKKNSTATGVASFINAFRTRYFVLHAGDANLYYFDTKAQRSLGEHPRAIPFLSFYTVTHIKDKKGQPTKSFILRVTSGRPFELEARNPQEAEKWVKTLHKLLPRENVAAIKVQSAIRMWKAKKARKLLMATVKAAREQREKARKDAEQATLTKLGFTQAAADQLSAQYKADALKVVKAARKVQAHLRMRVQRRKYIALRGGRVAAAAGTKSAAGAASALSTGAAATASPWIKYVDPNSGNPYWHNAQLNVTSWADPTDLVSGTLWRQLTDADSGESYFHNVSTNETTWTEPAEVKKAKRAEKLQKRKAMSRWIKKQDASGRVFYANVDSGETSWDAPAALADGTGRLIQGWFSKVDAGSQKKYYVNTESSQTQWEAPEGYSSDGSDAEEAAAPAPTTTTTTAVATAVTDEGPTEILLPASGRESMKVENPNVVASATEEAVAAVPSAAVVPVKPAGDNTSKRNLVAPKDQAAEGTSRASIRVARKSLNLDPNALIAQAAAEANDLVVDAKGDQWRAYTDPRTNKRYWNNEKTGESSWKHPSKTGSAKQQLGDANEVLTFSMWINAVLGEQPMLQDRLPLDIEAEPSPLFGALKDGVLLCRLVNAVAPNALDDRAVDYTATTSKEAACKDNCRLALAAAQGAGAVFGKNVTADAIFKQRQVAILDLLWQILKISLVPKVSVRSSGIAGISRLAAAGEEVDDLLLVSPEQMLIRWINFQVDKCAQATGQQALQHIDDFGKQLADGKVLCALVRTVAPEHANELPETADACEALGPEASITVALSAAFSVGVPAWFSVEGIMAGNNRLQMALAAYLFGVAPNLIDATPEPAVAAATSTPNATAATSTASTGASATASVTKSAGASAAASDGDAKRGKFKAGGQGVSGRVSIAEADSMEKQLIARLAAERRTGGEEGPAGAANREAKTVAQWINELDLDGVYVRSDSLGSDLKDGTVFLKVLNNVEPGVVNWHKATLKPGTNRYKMVENCNLAVSLGKAMDFTLVNVGGLDFVDGNVKLMLAYMWQLMRYSTLKTLSTLAFDGFATDEGEILTWANTKVSAAMSALGMDGSAGQISSFAEPEVSTGIYFLYLLNSVRSDCVNWDVVTDGDTHEHKVSNANYIIALARKIGASVYVSPHDIVEVKPKALMLFVASIMVLDSKLKAGVSEEDSNADTLAFSQHDDGGSTNDLQSLGSPLDSHPPQHGDHDVDELHIVEDVGMPLLGSCLFSLGLVHAITGVNEQITVSIGHSLSKLLSCQMPVPYLWVHIARGSCPAHREWPASSSRECDEPCSAWMRHRAHVIYRFKFAFIQTLTFQLSWTAIIELSLPV
jgi:hypothetical protein